MEAKTLLLMGMRRSGKSSICQVVFHNMRPLETLYLESTAKPTTETFATFVNYNVREMPGQIEAYDYEVDEIFANVGAIIYVIDSQDDYLYTIPNLVDIAEAAYKVNPNINVEVLMHKVDGLSDDFRIDCQRDILQRITDEFQEKNITNMRIDLHQTSIFDRSIYEAFSRIIQKLIPDLAMLENLINMVTDKSRIDKSFLLDINSKIYITTDISPVDQGMYELCSDFVDVAIDLESLYDPGDAQQPKSTYFRAYSKLSDNMTLSIHEMISGLALVTAYKGGDVGKMTVIDFNADVLRRGLMGLAAKQR